MLRDPDTLARSNLTAAEHRLLSTVVVESALLPSQTAVCLRCGRLSPTWPQCTTFTTPMFACTTPAATVDGRERTAVYI